MSQQGLPHLGVVDMGIDFSLDLDELLTKPYDDIGEAAVELPAYIEWVNIQLQHCTERKFVLKQSLRRARAEAYIRLRNGAWEDTITIEGTKKPSDAAMEYLIDAEDSVTQVNNELANYIGWALRLSNLLYVLQAKLDLVRSTESTRRNLISHHVEEAD